MKVINYANLLAAEDIEEIDVYKRQVCIVHVALCVTVFTKLCVFSLLITKAIVLLGHSTALCQKTVQFFSSRSKS